MGRFNRAYEKTPAFIARSSRIRTPQTPSRSNENVERKRQTKRPGECYPLAVCEAALKICFLAPGACRDFYERTALQAREHGRLGLARALFDRKTHLIHHAQSKLCFHVTTSLIVSKLNRFSFTETSRTEVTLHVITQACVNKSCGEEKRKLSCLPLVDDRNP